MTAGLLDIATIVLAVAGAFIAGFTTGLAGFGTGLVASGLWFHALPAAVVPPLVALSSVAAHVVGLATVRRSFAWRSAVPFLIGGAMGVPIGTTLLTVAHPESVRTAIGAFLVVYAAAQLTGLTRLRIGSWGGRRADGVVGVGGGVLGGFAGLSGPLPLIWLQLRGGPSDAQRATYQPFNMAVLSLSVTTMAIAGHIDIDVLVIAGLCLPATLLGAAIGARLYTLLSESVFQTVILMLLLVSGSVLVVQAITG